MRLSDIISLGMEYLLLGIFVVVVIGIGFSIWYFKFYRKRKDTNKKLNAGKLVLWCIFLIYLVVVLGATMLSRGNWYGNTRIYPLLYSYKDAWNDFSMTEWRNIVLNILMFVPYGFLVPLLNKKVQAFWKVYLLGFLATLFIEVMQLVLGKGIFEPDDLLGNTLGAMIGYGVYALSIWVASKWSWIKSEKNVKLKSILLYQIPLLIVVGSFVTIFIAYDMKELGNLGNSHIIKQKNLDVTTEMKFSDVDKEAIVYKVPILTVKETEELAKTIFSKQGLSIDADRNDVYENSALYYSDGGNRLSVWIDYDGGTFRYTDYDESFGDEIIVDDNATEEEIRQALWEIGIYVPNDACFENIGNGNYQFVAEYVVDSEGLYDGVITCTYNGNGKMGNVNYQLLQLDEYKSFPIISEKEAYEKLVNGEFLYYRQNEETLDITVTDVVIEYETDTKGYYQPVYTFFVLVNDLEGNITIDAIK